METGRKAMSRRMALAIALLVWAAVVTVGGVLDYFYPTSSTDRWISTGKN